MLNNITFVHAADMKNFAESARAICVVEMVSSSSVAAYTAVTPNNEREVRKMEENVDIRRPRRREIGITAHWLKTSTTPFNIILMLTSPVKGIYKGQI